MDSAMLATALPTPGRMGDAERRPEMHRLQSDDELVKILEYYRPASAIGAAHLEDEKQRR